MCVARLEHKGECEPDRPAYPALNTSLGITNTNVEGSLSELRYR